MQHLTMLQKGSFLMFPMIDKVDAYHKYTCIPLSYNLKNKAKKAGNGEYDGVIQQVNGNEEDDEDGADEEDDTDEELLEEKLNSVVHTSIKIGKAKVVSRWMLSLVNHMDALSVISWYYGKHANASPIDINISFISTKPPSHGASISDWKIFICQLAAPIDKTSELLHRSSWSPPSPISDLVHFRPASPLDNCPSQTSQPNGPVNLLYLSLTDWPVVYCIHL